MFALDGVRLMRCCDSLSFQVQSEVEVARAHLQGLHDEAAQLEAEMAASERRLEEQREAAALWEEEVAAREAHLTMRAQATFPPPLSINHINK